MVTMRFRIQFVINFHKKLRVQFELCEKLTSANKSQIKRENREKIYREEVTILFSADINLAFDASFAFIY